MWKIISSVVRGENAAKVWVSERLLRGWLGNDLATGILESSVPPVTPLLVYCILDRSERFVPIVDRAALVGLLDRLDLATRTAKEVLGERLGQ